MRISDWSSDVCSSDLEFHIDIGVREAVAHDLAARDTHQNIETELRGLPDDDAAALFAIRKVEIDHIRRVELCEARSGPAHLILLSRSEEHTSELQSLMRISYAVFCLKKKKKQLSLLTMTYIRCI